MTTRYVCDICGTTRNVARLEYPTQYWVYQHQCKETMGESYYLCQKHELSVIKAANKKVSEQGIKTEFEINKCIIKEIKLKMVTYVDNNKVKDMNMKVAIQQLNCPKCGQQFVYNKDGTMHCIKQDCTLCNVEYKQPKVKLERIRED